MGGGISTFIMLALVVASYIISAIVQAKAKRQEEEEARQATQERRAQAQAQAQARSGAPDQHPGGAPQTRQDALAARRRAQLEELRKRRETQSPGQRQRTGQDPSQSRPTRVPPQQGGTQRPQTAEVHTGTFDSPSEHHRVPVEQQRTAPTSRSGSRSPGQSPSQSPPAQRERTAREKASRDPRFEQPDTAGVPEDSPVLKGEIGAETEATDSEMPTEAPSAIGGPSSLIATLQRGEADPARLREAIVLKEVLDRPIGLRTEAESF